MFKTNSSGHNTIWGEQNIWGALLLNAPRGYEPVANHNIFSCLFLADHYCSNIDHWLNRSFLLLDPGRLILHRNDYFNRPTQQQAYYHLASKRLVHVAFSSST